MREELKPVLKVLGHVLNDAEVLDCFMELLESSCILSIEDMQRLYKILATHSDLARPTLLLAINALCIEEDAPSDDTFMVFLSKLVEAFDDPKKHKEPLWALLQLVGSPV